MIVVPDGGAIWHLTRALKSVLFYPETLSLRLFKNDYTPDKATVPTSFVECTLPGYVRYALDRAAFTDPAPVAGVVTIGYSVDPITFNSGLGSQVVYGYYVYSPTFNAIAWAERFDIPRTVDATHPLKLSLKFTGRSQV